MPGGSQLHFYGDSPRHTQCIGWEDSNAIYYGFVTPRGYASSVRTEISRHTPTRGGPPAERIVAYFDWTSGTHLGMANILEPESEPFPMSNLIKSKTKGYVMIHPPSFLPKRCTGPYLQESRCIQFFLRHEQSMYEWRIGNSCAKTYSLFKLSTNAFLGQFTETSEVTEVGPSYGLFKFSFKNSELLLTALMSLTLIRWTEMHGY